MEAHPGGSAIAAADEESPSSPYTEAMFLSSENTGAGTLSLNEQLSIDQEEEFLLFQFASGEVPASSRCRTQSLGAIPENQHGSRRRTRRLTLSTPPSVTSTISSSSSASPTRPGNTVQEEAARPRNGTFLRSLDAGMTVVQRWVHRPSETASSHATSTPRSLPTTPRRIRSGQTSPRAHWDVFREPVDARDEHLVRAQRRRTFSEPDVIEPPLLNRFSGGESSYSGRRRSPESQQLSSTAAAALYNNDNATPEISPSRQRSFTDGGIELSGQQTRNLESTPSVPSAENTSEDDPERQARIRWIQINRRFQIVITAVATLFCLLLFCILLGWIYLTSAYIVGFDKPCDVLLKRYYWLVTFQLILDVFRSDIVRVVFQYDVNSTERIPCQVVIYNVTYMIYACLVVRLGVTSVYMDEDSTCPNTAPELYQASFVFVTLSLAAWMTIIFGYLLPFCVVAGMLTWNGYHPSGDTAAATNTGQAVFPAAYSTSGAPIGCINQLKYIRMEDYPAGFPGECCICMEGFNLHDDVVETECKHIFHKSCCREWLRQARTCPVCRDDIPSSLSRTVTTSDEEENEQDEEPNRQPSSRIPLGPTGQPVRGLIRMLAPNSEESNSLEQASEQHSSSHSASYRPTRAESSLDLEQGPRPRPSRLFTTEF